MGKYDATKDLFLLTLLAQTISSVDKDSETLKFVSENEMLDKIFGMAIQIEDVKLSTEAMSIIYELCGKCNEEDESEPSIFKRVFGYIAERGMIL